MICENCNVEHDGSYGSGRFCSCKCARGFASKEKRQEINEKVSKTLLKRRELGLCKTNFNIRYCKDCGKQLGFKNTSGYCHSCCPKHSNAKIEVREKHRQIQLQKVVNGTHQGWKARNIKSYAEIFWATVLDNNNIVYEREKRVGKYFLDFVIGKLDLEIDGKQHQYEDRKQSDNLRDEFLTKEGYFVYRVKWNEINSIEGKQMMKDKIDSFLAFYKTIGDMTEPGLLYRSIIKRELA